MFRMCRKKITFLVTSTDYRFILLVLFLHIPFHDSVYLVVQHLFFHQLFDEMKRDSIQEMFSIRYFNKTSNYLHAAWCEWDYSSRSFYTNLLIEWKIIDGFTRLLTNLHEIYWPLFKYTIRLALNERLSLLSLFFSSSRWQCVVFRSNVINN